MIQVPYKTLLEQNCVPPIPNKFSSFKFSKVSQEFRAFILFFFGLSETECEIPSIYKKWFESRTFVSQVLEDCHFEDEIDCLFLLTNSNLSFCISLSNATWSKRELIWTTCCKELCSKNSLYVEFFVPGIEESVKIKGVNKEVLLSNKIGTVSNSEVLSLLEDYKIGFSTSILDLNPTELPFQVFLRHSVSGEAYQLDKLREKKKFSSSWKLYVHSILSVNFASSYWSKKHETVIEDLKICSSFRGRGVVIHVGSRGKLSEEEAVENMKKNVLRILPFASERCKLLIETGCGEGTEILWKTDKLREFVLSFSVKERKKIGMVFDTCHLFVAGYDPLEELQKWQDCEIPVCLVHFNDSKTARCSHCDRHEVCGRGYLGMEKMRSIASYCSERGIDCVTEF